MGRPLIGDRPMSGAEKTKRHRQKLRGIVEPTPPQSSEPSAEELLKQARREILELRRENERLRAEAGLTAGKTLEGVPQDASAVVITVPAHGPLSLTEIVNRALAADSAFVA